MAIQLGEQKKKKPIIVILFVLILVIFGGFKIYQILTTKPIVKNTPKTNSNSGISSILANMDQILTNPKFQELKAHVEEIKEPSEIGKEDPFVK